MGSAGQPRKAVHRPQNRGPVGPGGFEANPISYDPIMILYPSISYIRMIHTEM